MMQFILASLFLAFPCFATSFSFGESIEVKYEKEFVDLALRDEAYCIDLIKGRRIYLNPERIYPTKEGLFLRLADSTLIRISHLGSDETGCFIEI